MALRRSIKIALSILATLLLIAGVALGVLYLRMQAKNAGPPPPLCSAPSLPRRSFERPVRLSRALSTDDYDIEPAAALLPTGTLAIAYNTRAHLFSPSSIRLVTVAPDGAIAEGRLPTDRSQHFDIWMDADARGRLNLVWLGHDGGLPDKHVQIGYSTSDDGLSWSPPRAIHDVAHDCPGELRGCMDKPMIAIGPAPARSDGGAGEVIRAFYFSEATEGLRMVSSSDGGAHFSESVPAASGAYGDVAITPSGRIHLVDTTWEAPDANRFGDRRIRVEHTASGDGRSFSAPTTVSAPDDVVPFFFSNPQVVVDEPRHLLYALYPAGADLRWNLWLATSRDDGRSWSRVRVNDDAPCAIHMTPTAALDPRTGTLHVTWLENRSGSGALAYAECESGGGRCGPNEQVSDGPFASFRLSRHQDDWLGEYGVLLLDPTRRVLHAVWTQPVSDGGRRASRIHWARRRLD